MKPIGLACKLCEEANGMDWFEAWKGMGYELCEVFFEEIGLILSWFLNSWCTHFGPIFYFHKINL